MAITRAQQFRQMLEDGGMLVQPSMTGKRPGYRTSYRSRMDSGEVKESRSKNKSNTSVGGEKNETGRDPTAQFRGLPPGYKTSAKAKAALEAQRKGAQETIKQQREDAISGIGPYAGTVEPTFSESITNLLNPRKRLYNTFPNNPNTELSYLSSLSPAVAKKLPPRLKAIYDNLQNAEFFDDEDYETALGDDYRKFTFEEFEDLRKFNPDEGRNFAEFAAEIKGKPGLLFGGDIGNLKKIKNPDGTFSYERDYSQDDPILFPQGTAPGDPNQNPGDGGGGSGNTQTGGGLAFRFMSRGGSPMDAPTEGGIMDLETGRQMYFLGKLVKKATRAVKKIAKSPIGKAAIGAALFKMGGGFKGLGTLKGTLFGQAGSRVGESFIPYKEGLFTKLGLTKGGGSMMPTLLGGGVGLLSLLPFLTEEEQEQIASDRGKGLDIPYIRNNPYTFASQVGAGGSGMATAFLADGGRIGYQEGSKEPVAKKTMPLLDMDGKEMDLRDDGGFVPIGRMEKADDVPARLSKNEFVFTADAVRNAGGGDVDKGAEVMYNMMKNLESGGEVSEESQGLEGAREMFQTSKRLEEVL